MLPYYPFYWADYSSKTYDLTQGQHGAYLLFLRHIYTTGKPIPDKQKFSIARALLEQEQENATFVLETFFTLKNGFWVQDRAFQIIAEQQNKHQARVKAGKLGGKQKSSNASSKRLAMLKQPEPEPNNNPLPPKGEPDGFEYFWEHYPKVRPGSKDKARTAYTKALTRATKEEINNGMENYRRSREGSGQDAEDTAAGADAERWKSKYDKPGNVQATRPAGRNLDDMKKIMRIGAENV